MEAFPIKTFWDNVIIVNFLENPQEETFTDYISKSHENFIEKIVQCDKLKSNIDNKNINLPSKLKVYSVCSKTRKIS